MPPGIMPTPDFSRCSSCNERVRVLRRTLTLSEHWRANPRWTVSISWVGSVLATERCPGSGTAATGHTALYTATRPRGTCPGCNRSIALTTRGLIRPHHCEAPPRHGEPPATWRCMKCLLGLQECRCLWLDKDGRQRIGGGGPPLASGQRPAARGIRVRDEE